MERYTFNEAIDALMKMVKEQHEEDASTLGRRIDILRRKEKLELDNEKLELVKAKLELDEAKLCEEQMEKEIKRLTDTLYNTGKWKSIEDMYAELGRQ